jgi:hypothetical protein
MHTNHAKVPGASATTQQPFVSRAGWQRNTFLTLYYCLPPSALDGGIYLEQFVLHEYPDSSDRFTITNYKTDNRSSKEKRNQKCETL